MEDSKQVAASVIHGEDWYQVNGRAYPYSAVVYLKRTRKNNNGKVIDEGGCSAAMIGPYTVLTAAHCVYKNLTANFQGFYYPENIIAYAGGSESPIHARGTRILVAPGTRNLNWGVEFQKQDYAIVVLDKPIGKKSGTLGVQETTFQKGQQISVVGFPATKDLVNPWFSPGNVTGIFEGWIEFDADVLPGNSGSPVFVNNDLNYIVAVASFESTDYNGASTSTNHALLLFVNQYRDEKPATNGPSPRNRARKR